MKLSDYIKMLQNFSEEVEDLEVCIYEEGYYSSGDQAHVYDVPKVRNFGPEKFIVLGESIQNY